MIKNEGKLEAVFRKLHGIPDSGDVRLVYRDEFESELGGVGLFKDDRLCWSASLDELALDLLLEEELVIAKESERTMEAEADKFFNENKELKGDLKNTLHNYATLEAKLAGYKAAIDAVVKTGNQPTRSNHPTYVKIPVDDFDALKALLKEVEG